VLKDGKKIKGVLTASCFEEAREKLISEGFEVISLKETNVKKGISKSRFQNVATNVLVGVGFVLMLVLIVMYLNSQGTAGQKIGRKDPGKSPSEWIDIERYIGGSNRGVKKIKDFVSENGEIKITFFIDDGGSKENTQRAARKDIYGMLRAINLSNYNYKNVSITGTFPLVDKIGQKREADVVIINFDRENIRKIDWNNFAPEQVYYKARSFWVHEDFK
jgi:hypothetical protein